MKKFKMFSLNSEYLINIISAILLIFIIVSINSIFFSGKGASVNTFNRLSAQSTDEPVSSREGSKLAIIIDDFGQNRSGVKEMMSINKHLTFAIMPFLTFSRSDAEKAHENGYEVIVHLPLEASSGNMSWVGPRPILTAMTDNDIQHLVIDAFDSIPNAVGANIHMGSKASEDERVISDILDIIKIKNLYFVDSRTSPHPIAKKIADSKGVLCYDRNVFLDGKKPKSYILNQLKKAGDIALTKGSAIAIGHVGTEGGAVTAEAIQESLEEFDNKKIKLVFVSELNELQK